MVNPPASSPLLRQPVTLCVDALSLFESICALHVAAKNRPPKTSDITRKTNFAWSCMVAYLLSNDSLARAQVSTVSFLCWHCVALGAFSAGSLATNSFHPNSGLRLFLEDLVYHTTESVDEVRRASAF